MALNFKKLQEIAVPSRVIDSIVDANVKYEGLTVPVKLVTLEGNRKGMVTLDRFEAFKNAITENAEGNAELPASWKIGKAKNGLEHGYFYNSEELSGNSTATLVLG